MRLPTPYADRQVPAASAAASGPATISASRRSSGSTLRIEKISADAPARGLAPATGLDTRADPFQHRPRRRASSRPCAARSSTTRATSPSCPPAAGYVAVVGDTALAPLGSDYGYTKLQIRAARAGGPCLGKHVLRLEFGYGAVTGNAPFFEKFYVGDFTDLLPDRVLDLNFDRRTAPELPEDRHRRGALRRLRRQAPGRVPHPASTAGIARSTASIFSARPGVYGVATYRDLDRSRRAATTGFARSPSISRSTSAFASTPAREASSSRSPTSWVSSPYARVREPHCARRTPGACRALLRLPYQRRAGRGALRQASFGFDERQMLRASISYHDVVDGPTVAKLKGGLPTTIVMHTFVVREAGRPCDRGDLQKMPGHLRFVGRGLSDRNFAKRQRQVVDRIADPRRRPPAMRRGRTLGRGGTIVSFDAGPTTSQASSR